MGRWSTSAQEPVAAGQAEMTPPGHHTMKEFMMGCMARSGLRVQELNVKGSGLGGIG